MAEKEIFVLETRQVGGLGLVSEQVRVVQVAEAPAGATVVHGPERDWHVPETGTVFVDLAPGTTGGRG
jgi:hypothetical protein